MEFCKKLNARLPLPRTKLEADEFRKISPSFTHVDARNPHKTADKTKWIDVEGKLLGDRPVYARIKNCSTLLKNYLTLFFDLFKVGNRVSQ